MVEAHPCDAEISLDDSAGAIAYIFLHPRVQPSTLSENPPRVLAKPLKILFASSPVIKEAAVCENNEEHLNFWLMWDTVWKGFQEHRARPFDYPVETVASYFEAPVWEAYFHVLHFSSQRANTLPYWSDLGTTLLRTVDIRTVLGIVTTTVDILEGIEQLSKVFENKPFRLLNIVGYTVQLLYRVLDCWDAHHISESFVNALCYLKEVCNDFEAFGASNLNDFMSRASLSFSQLVFELSTLLTHSQQPLPPTTAYREALTDLHDRLMEAPFNWNGSLALKIAVLARCLGDYDVVRLALSFYSCDDIGDTSAEAVLALEALQLPRSVQLRFLELRGLCRPLAEPAQLGRLSRVSSGGHQMESEFYPLSSTSDSDHWSVEQEHPPPQKTPMKARENRMRAVLTRVQRRLEIEQKHCKSLGRPCCTEQRNLGVKKGTADSVAVQQYQGKASTVKKLTPSRKQTIPSPLEVNRAPLTRRLSQSVAVAVSHDPKTTIRSRSCSIQHVVQTRIDARRQPQRSIMRTAAVAVLPSPCIQPTAQAFSPRETLLKTIYRFDESDNVEVFLRKIGIPATELSWLKKTGDSETHHENVTTVAPPSTALMKQSTESDILETTTDASSTTRNVSGDAKETPQAQHDQAPSRRKRSKRKGGSFSSEEKQRRKLEVRPRKSELQQREKQAFLARFTEQARQLQSKWQQGDVIVAVPEKRLPHEEDDLDKLIEQLAVI